VFCKLTVLHLPGSWN